jgi:hypothetical protein
MEIKPYGKGYVVIGDTYEHRDKLKDLGCSWNKFLTINGEKSQGWICSGQNIDNVRKIILGEDESFSITDLSHFNEINVYYYLSKNGMPESSEGYLKSRYAALIHMAESKKINKELSDLILSKEFAEASQMEMQDLGKMLAGGGADMMPGISRFAAEIFFVAIVSTEGDEITTINRDILLRADSRFKSFF